MNDQISKDKAIDIVHKTMREFIEAKDGEPFTDKDLLLFSVNKAICTKIRKEKPNGKKA